MKTKLALLLLPLSAFILTFCHKDSNDAPAPTTPVKAKGSILFWTNNPQEINACGVLTIALNTGQQSNITGYYFVAPANCINQFGGYFNIDEGTYTYTIISSNGCTIPGGTATVIGGQCNMTRIQ